MILVDSHSHLFLDVFAEDLPQVIERARSAGVSHIFMPNIDCSTIEPMLAVCTAYKELCYPMIGLHPTSVNTSYMDELSKMEELLAAPNSFVAVGEVGIDLYWDKTFKTEQCIAFEKQIEWALAYNLPLVIHSREAFEPICEILQHYKDTPLRGIFHSFTGDADEASTLLEFSRFLIGVNGVVTFKNSNLGDVLKDIPLNRIVLETDSPYLTPAPNRGKRNESAYVKDVLLKVSELYQASPEAVAQCTSENALKMFGIGDNEQKDFKIY